MFYKKRQKNSAKINKKMHLTGDKRRFNVAYRNCIRRFNGVYNVLKRKSPAMTYFPIP